MRLNIPINLFVKLFHSNLSALEAIELDTWRNSSELNQNVYDEIIEDVKIREAILSNRWVDNSQEWEKVVSKLTTPKINFTLSYKSLYLTVTTAAIFLLLIGISSGILYNRIIQKNTKIPDGYTYIFSPRGQRTRVILPDQTMVWLNSESSLRYPVNYNQKTREVQIKGEAFFKVHKNPKKPFIVYANEIKVKVYGTSFNVKAFPNEKNIETTLIEGKLSITTKDKNGKFGEEIFLKPNEKCIYKKFHIADPTISTTTSDQTDGSKAPKSDISEEPEVILAKNINTKKEVEWKDGKLIFSEETFELLAVKLERWYDMKIHFTDEGIKNYKFTGVFDRETINQALEALKLSSQKSFKYEIIFRDIYLSTK